jgi:hypothetical protein
MDSFTALISKMVSKKCNEVLFVFYAKGIVGTKVYFNEDTPFKSKKDLFLGNVENKQNFITLLANHLRNQGCKTIQAVAISIEYNNCIAVSITDILSIHVNDFTKSSTSRPWDAV